MRFITSSRWFCRTIGGEGAEKREAKMTLWFAFLFCLGRYVLPIPYWIIFMLNFNSRSHLLIKTDLPPLTDYFIFFPGLLDVLNIAWGIPVYAVTRKALAKLGKAMTEKPKPVLKQSDLIDHTGDRAVSNHCHTNGNLHVD